MRPADGAWENSDWAGYVGCVNICTKKRKSGAPGKFVGKHLRRQSSSPNGLHRYTKNQMLKKHVIVQVDYLLHSECFKINIHCFHSGMSSTQSLCLQFYRFYCIET